MATLIRPKITQQISDASLTRLDTSIPKPFPSNEERLQDELLEELANEKVGFHTIVESVAGSSQSAEPSQRPQNYDVLVSKISIVLRQNMLMWQ
jgi:hypothetical protein